MCPDTDSNHNNVTPSLTPNHREQKYADTIGTVLVLGALNSTPTPTPVAGRCSNFFRQKIAATNFDHYWHRRHSIRIRVYETVRYLSVFSSVRLSVRSPAAAACGGFAAVGPAGSRYRSIAARPAPQQHGAAARRTAANAGSATFSAYEVN